MVFPSSKRFQNAKLCSVLSPVTVYYEGKNYRVIIIINAMITIIKKEQEKKLRLLFKSLGLLENAFKRDSKR